MICAHWTGYRLNDNLSNAHRSPPSIKQGAVNTLRYLQLPVILFGFVRLFQCISRFM
ncbi:hypothetical protein CLOSYM_01896 [[Clostridium] symbiosum ATCC 14940]|uniref:Uncharacterized protein n=1 Tax=[Clostridium] symbiosum ATCC 14940 TaxID=411472 RepID=A0ABC9TYY0_CLOSY|nr:hypothetical protein CLOSYM_01896 [[Clostridium] symbiosum ATCC 14940]